MKSVPTVYGSIIAGVPFTFKYVETAKRTSALTTEAEPLYLLPMTAKP
jgi:hypothetical protein